MKRILTTLRRRTRDAYDQRIHPLSWRERLGLCLLLAACLAVVVKAMLVPPLDDPWAYSLWYIEEWLLSHGFHLPTCGYVSSVGNYDPYWGKICVDIDTPAAAYLSSGLTALTGLDFVHRWTRFFLLTPLVKFVVGYLLASLYTDDTRYRTLCATAIFLMPDYSPLYITEARGLSFPITLLGFYTTIRWSREGGRWFWTSAGILALTSMFYLPRSLLLLPFIFVIGVLRWRRDGSRRDVVLGTVVGPLILLALHGDRLSHSGGEFTGFDFSNTLGVIGSRFGFGTVRPVPFLLSWPPYVMIILVPVALVSAVSAFRALSREGSQFLLDERMLWLYSVLVVYIPAGLSVSFFWTRIFFEASIPGLLVAVGELDSLSLPGSVPTYIPYIPRFVADHSGYSLRSRVPHFSLPARISPSRDRIARFAHVTGYVIIALMVVGNLLVIPGVWTFPYRGDYDKLVNGMHQNGVERGDPIFTDLKTGAYLVGMDRYEIVYRNTDDYDRQGLVDVWYGTNATAACEEMRSYGADYFILNREVSTQVIYVENYQRKPINRSAYLKFDRSPLFTPVVRQPEFTVFRIDRGCRPSQSQRSASTRSA
ncbi:hypothetical protein A4G99_00345 [Haladaptatus sp. R4]|uniref:hypothetical protein n=1 Tax=Haladaptatus sp. R4 TaxID=1679489 RepID=UPI0007B4D51A|nr:hypothetical protein [Haladaptatus sp. R4]KZN25032.1 hypothetical protein A4G99_00345 [Haladaptatus sp. R4]